MTMRKTSDINGVPVAFYKATLKETEIIQLVAIALINKYPELSGLDLGLKLIHSETFWEISVNAHYVEDFRPSRNGKDNTSN